MIHVVKIAPTAERQLHKFDPQIRRRVQAAIGAGEWRVRTGEYRIVYDIRDGLVTVLVLKVGHRRDVYEAR
jgi:mRNA interferase RelE/StbE